MVKLVLIDILQSTKKRGSPRPWYNRKWIIKSRVWVDSRLTMLVSSQISISAEHWFTKLHSKHSTSSSYLPLLDLWCSVPSGRHWFCDEVLSLWCTLCPSTCLACFTPTASRERCELVSLCCGLHVEAEKAIATKKIWKQDFFFSSHFLWLQCAKVYWGNSGSWNCSICCFNNEFLLV